MQTLLRDLKYTLRSFRESPGFTATAIVALALGIGANVAIFSVVNAVLIKPVPFPAPDRLDGTRGPSTSWNEAASWDLEPPI